MPIIKVFRRFNSNNTSARQVVTEISNLVPGSNVELSQRSSVAPNPSKRPIRKKVASADRRLMLESFVNKYRAMNVGKFPPPTSAQKEVGGSYYIIRKMLQEMEYNFRISSEKKGLVKENKEMTKVEDTISREIVIESSGIQEESNSQVTINQQLCEDPLLESKGEDTISTEIAIDSSGSQEESNSQVTSNQQLCKDPLLESVSNFELKEGLQPSHDTHNIATNSDDIKGQCHQKPEQERKDESPSEDNFVFEDSQLKVENQHDGIRNITRDMPEHQRDGEMREKPSLWGSLKLMATDFINIWKK